jgi:hypothetical protein
MSSALKSAPRPFTVADYMSLPEEEPRYQLVGGELYMSPSPDMAYFSKQYARTGVLELWIVEPDTRPVKVYRLAENAEIPSQTLTQNKVLTSPLLPGLEIALSRIFPPER